MTSKKFLKSILNAPYKIYKELMSFVLTVYIKIFGLGNGKKRLRLLSRKKSNELIRSMINSDKPFMIARYGGTEFSNLTIGGEDYFKKLVVLSGFFPEDLKLFKKFKEVYNQSSRSLDVLAIWIYKHYFFTKKKFLMKIPPLNHLIPLDSLNPLYNNWIEDLDGKRVLVVHPFKSSILYQYKRRKCQKIIPNFKSLEVIGAVQTIAGQKDDRFQDWFEALDYMKKEIEKRKDKFDIALIGCGAYGFPLAAYVKSLGKKAIHMAGVLQLLFGIKGKRWEDEGILFSKEWIYPLGVDTPKDNKKVEGGCYW